MPFLAVTGNHDTGNRVSYQRYMDYVGSLQAVEMNTEYGETEHENALREILEETGIKARLIDGFREEYTFTTLENTIKTGAFFLADYTYREIKRQEEEITEDWLLPYEKAYEQLNWKEDKKVLEAAEMYLNSLDMK